MILDEKRTRTGNLAIENEISEKTGIQALGKEKLRKMGMERCRKRDDIEKW